MRELDGSMATRLLPLACLTLSFLALSPAAWAECPPAAEILDILDGLDLDRTTRSARFSIPTPTALFERAVSKPGRPAVSREGKQVQAAMVVDRPLEPLWKAINDEDHHALNGYLPVRYSEVVDGEPRGESRVLFQYFKQWGIGRWWLSRVEINEELFRQSDGSLWELRWEDVMEEADPTRPPINSVSSDIRPLVATRGAWLFVSLGASCTFIEFYNWSDPGGALSVAQALMAKRTVRNTLNGVVRMAEEHVGEPHPEAHFVRADGTPLE
jgi:hypothetical protein